MGRRLLVLVVIAVTAASVGLTVPAAAAVTLHADGTGSVGREDVLRAVGWGNDRLLTSAAELDLVAETVTVATAAWECVQESTGAVAVQERRTTTTVRAALVTAVQRSSVTGAVTGFELRGFAEDAVAVTVVEGPALDACPGDEGEGAAWSRVPRSTERARTHEGPALDVVHEGVAHRVPSTQNAAA
ncbi:hypothetical protein [Kocuria sp. NPDC057446]|uniref:hypothetical protein n=1 Tax=Kocuria sp. NPDC057446 TaxID=3346137 RepID=UPI0036BE46B8